MVNALLWAPAKTVANEPVFLAHQVFLEMLLLQCSAAAGAGSAGSLWAVAQASWHIGCSSRSSTSTSSSSHSSSVLLVVIIIIIIIVVVVVVVAASSSSS